MSFLDPLNNPRPVWAMNFDHRTIAGRWGMFLAKVLRLRWGTWRAYREIEKAQAARLSARKGGAA